MYILHGTWIPLQSQSFHNGGEFVIWIEALQTTDGHLKAKELHKFLESIKTFKEVFSQCNLNFQQYAFLLPTVENKPIPSLHALALNGQTAPTDYQFAYHPITCCSISSPLHRLKQLQFALLQQTDILLGQDFVFWRHYLELLNVIVTKDHYIPSIRIQKTDSSIQPIQAVSAPKKRSSPQNILETQYIGYYGWQILSPLLEEQLLQFVAGMPDICAAGHSLTTVIDAAPSLHDKESLLRHAASCILTQAIQRVTFSNTLQKSIAKTCLKQLLVWRKNTGDVVFTNQDQPLHQTIYDWQQWQQQLTEVRHNEAFHLAFRLISPTRSHDLFDITSEAQNDWQCDCLLISKRDPSFQQSLHKYWQERDQQKEQQLKNYFGEQIERNLLLLLGYAAQIYPPLWQMLDSIKFTALHLTTADALLFLQEYAGLLQDAGFKLLLPTWYTPQGRRKTLLRIKAKGKSNKSSSKHKSYLTLTSLVDYQYQLSLGGESITQTEWQQLMAAKSSLVYFRGEWMEIDPSEMNKLLTMWQTQHATEQQETTLLDFLQIEAQADESIEFDCESELGDLLQGLQNKKTIPLVEQPHALQGTLRDYQKLGMSWLVHLQNLGLNSCLADDMGLGKTVQVIASLLLEQQNKQQELPPTLLIVPTSVVPNWQREIVRFAPTLKTYVHTGLRRVKEQQQFQSAIQNIDVMITSYAILRRDQMFFENVEWHRIVLDEAQNIKNPETTQTKLICKLKSHHRLALTGTPVENRLTDLWSILHFLNPGYLGRHKSFKQTFEMPIQRDNDLEQAQILKRMVEPLILRRLKSDRSIIQDLPDKIETKVYTHLSKEQASLYQAVVAKVEQEIEQVEGIARKGLILATLMQLKQICNHPAQFLQDRSAFSLERSQKMIRLFELIEEVIAEGNSLLIFSQFQTIIVQLATLLREQIKIPVYVLHGGTQQKERDRMIQAFQDPNSGPAIFLLSLKAGGVGITLTKASHVFHFDRWWNPAVEDQASDRAYRIGQKQTVFIHKFVTEGTLEERIDAMIEDKRKLAGSIIGGEESWLSELNNASFKKLIQLNPTVAIGA